MDTVATAKTWVDFGFHVFDATKDYLLPVLAGLLGWVIPSPIRRKGKAF